MGNLLSSNSALTKCKKHSGFSTTITTSFTPATRPSGLVWDGTDIWWGSDGGGSNKARKGTGFTGTVQTSFVGPWVSTLPYGFARDGNPGNLLSLDADTKVYKQTGFTATLGNSFTYGGGSNRGIAWDGTNVIVNDVSTPKIAKMTGFSSTVSASFTTNLPEGDVTWDGTDLYGRITNKVRQYSAFSSTILSSIAYDAFGLDWDTFPPPLQTKTVDETLALTDTAVRAPAKVVLETITPTDTATPVRVQIKSVSDTANMTDAVSNQAGKSILETLSPVDTVVRMATKVISDTATLTDTATSARVLVRTILDAIGLTDTTSTASTLLRTILDTLGLTDAVVARGLWVRRSKPVTSWTPRPKP